MYIPLKLKPGLDVEKTPLLNETGWSQSAAVRFRDGLPEKMGGWARLNAEPLVGICTGLHVWADLSSNNYAAAGTDQRLEIYYGGNLYDITPLRSTTNPTPDFTTTIGSSIVEVGDTANNAAVGDWIDLITQVAVGGIVLYGLYQVTEIVDANTYKIDVGVNAISSVSNGGVVPEFTTTMGSPDVTVTLINHGLDVGDIFTVGVSTVSGGLTISGNQEVTSVTDADNFVIAPGGSASSSDNDFENGGNARIGYLIHSGSQNSEYTVEFGYGVGGYGVGSYGATSSVPVLAPLREWFLDNFGQDLVGNYTGSPIYVWEPPGLTIRALAIDTTNYPLAAQPPTAVNFSFVAAPQQMIIALGTDDPDTLVFDPNLVRWCQTADFTDWQARTDNLAGKYRIPSGSKIVGGISASNFTVIWTDVDMWLMSFLGGTSLAQLAWGFSKIATGVDLYAPRGCAVYKNLVFWVASNGFFYFDGNQVRQIECPVWDKFWKNLNRVQANKINAQVNSWFQEVSWAAQSEDGTEVDFRITYNIRENSWTYDDNPTLTARTAWVDDNVLGAPIGTDAAGYLQQAETGYDADGSPLPTSIRSGWFAASEGTLIASMERIMADLYTNGNYTLQLTVYTQDYPLGPVRTYGPYNWNTTSGPPYSIVKARGRFFSIELSSTQLSIWWRLGNTRYFGRQAGKLP